jgi:hypothetical protein
VVDEYAEKSGRSTTRLRVPYKPPHDLMTQTATTSDMVRRSEIVIPALGGVGLGMAIFVLSVVGKNHFGPLDGLCNGSLNLEPHQGVGAVANCSLDTTLYSMAVYGYWAGIVLGGLSAVVFAVGLIVVPETLAAPKQPRVAASVPRTVRTRQAIRGPAPSVDSGRKHVRCTACNALNYTNSGDVPCYACGALL